MRWDVKLRDSPEGPSPPRQHPATHPLCVSFTVSLSLPLPASLCFPAALEELSTLQRQPPVLSAPGMRQPVCSLVRVHAPRAFSVPPGSSAVQRPGVCAAEKVPASRESLAAWGARGKPQPSRGDKLGKQPQQKQLAPSWTPKALQRGSASTKGLRLHFLLGPPP